MADMAREWYPELKDRIVQGQPGDCKYKNPGVHVVSNEKSKKDPGMRCKFKWETSADDRSIKEGDFQG
jgi:hypothetical protein